MTIIKEGGRKRSDKDFYPTPIEFARAVVNTVIPKECSPAFICDPGAGTGVWGKALKEVDKFKPSYLVGVDKFFEKPSEDYDEWDIDDYLNYTFMFGTYDLIIGNPPYSLAEEFIRQSLEILNGEGYLIFLLRLSMLESATRGKGLWKETPLKEVNVCIQRISFTGDGHTDDTAYGVFVWKKDFVGSPILKWLDWR